MMKLPTWLRWLLITLGLATLVITAGSYAWRFIINPCEAAEVADLSTILKTQLGMYDRVYQVATTSLSGDLDPPLLVMQTVQMDTQQIEVPACMETAKQELVSYMDTVIQAFRLWEQAGGSTPQFQSLIQQSDTHYGNFRAELENLAACAPYCLPFK